MVRAMGKPEGDEFIEKVILDFLDEGGKAFFIHGRNLASDSPLVNKGWWGMRTEIMSKIGRERQMKSEG
jgi:hypothetical protein